MSASRVASVCVSSLLCGLAVWLVAAEQAPQMPPDRQAAQKAMQAGNFKDAYEAFRKLALDPQVDAKLVGSDLTNGISCLQNLGRWDEVDAFREAVITAQAKNWRLLQTAATSYINDQHYGFIVAGEFYRGNRRGNDGKFVSSADRDRVRALQLFDQALPLALPDDDKAAVAQLHIEFANALLFGAGQLEAWRLQVLTDLTKLPDYDETAQRWGWGRRGGWGGNPNVTGAPVDAEGNPVYHKLPESYAASATDGERWRWLLSQAIEIDPKRRNEVELGYAQFLHSQFGVQTMRSFGWSQEPDDDTQKNESGTFALHTLSDDETIAKLATGIKRFKLPDEYNPLKLYQQIAARKTKDTFAPRAADQVAQIYEDRRQYPKAAEAWKTALAVYGDDNHRQARVDQIVGNWGRFEPAQTQSAGKGGTVEFRFRNANKVAFEAWEVDVPKLLADVKAYLKSNPARLEWNKINISEVGQRLVWENQNQYIKARVAQWSLDLKPRPEHVDERITVTTPLQKSGAYLVTAKLENGNVSRIVMWLADTVIAKKQLDGKVFYFVADAVSGLPVAKANVEFFGWKQEQVQPNRNVYRVVTNNFAEFSDADGQVILGENRMPNDRQWLITATNGDGRLAFLGFTHVWFGRQHDAEYNETKVFTITDRPVYRPSQPVKLKAWIRHAKYDQADTSDFAKQRFTLTVGNPEGQEIQKTEVTTDEFGGLEGEYLLPKDAKLGNYTFVVWQGPNGLGAGNFRVEEYKKPEFEVLVDAPKEPVSLGEKVTATVTAKYLFGAPVTKATVKYKVLRSNYSGTWYPPAPWDWFYGKGYWWFAYDYTWYPGWHSWGCMRPIGWWWGAPQNPPEVVAEHETTIGEDGTIKIEIDTLPAKELHPNQDHKYQITAEVVDESRRTIVGQGDVLVARKPFKVFAWVDRGHYRVGDTVAAHFKAQTLDQKPVQGKGELTLFQISYDENQQPVEKEVQKWNLDTNVEGYAVQQLKASEKGQYRLSYKLTDTKEHTIEGGYVFVVMGEGFDGREFRFNDLELVTDKKEYAPGETVKLMINTNRAGGAVALFLRPTNGIYQEPKIIRLKGKSTVEEVAVVTKDMPNFFIEAMTIADSKLHSDVREVVVPPEKRVLNIAVEPSQTEYKPGQEATVKVKLTDLDGKPYVGSTVVTIYDKAVEYISGGSNVPDIKEFFWKWRRHHHPQTESTLQRTFHNLLRQGEKSMNNLGAFGDNVVEEMTRLPGTVFSRDRGGRNAMPMAATAAPAAPADAAKSEMQVEFAAGGLGLADGEGGQDLVQPTVRTNFADTAFWAASVTTKADGTAQVSLTMPENLTGWKVKVWGLTHGTKVGEGSVEVTTKKNLLVRLQAPRFFVEKDEVVLSANVHNYLKNEKTVEVALELDGGSLSPMGDVVQKVSIAANGEQRVDWRVKVTQEGEAVVRMKALSDEESDAMEMKFPVYVHGMLKTESFSGVIRPDQTQGEVAITVPAERRINDSRLEVRYSPTLAGAMVDALPYMADYPYGCTEQTLNRFLPTVITQKILLRMNLDLKAIRDKRANLNAQEIGDPMDRAKQWKRFDRNPVFDEAEVATMVKSGLEALTAMQLSDGGWGWFSGYGEHSGAHTTAVVVHGLQVAKANDVAIVPGVLENGVAWLKRHQENEVRKLKNAPTKTVPWKDRADELDALVYMVLVDSDVANNDMLEFLHRDRVKLQVYAKALYGLALQKQKQEEKLKIVLENISQFLVEDAENQTAYLKLPEGTSWWYWWGDDIEANAYYLKLLTRTSPKSPQASGLVKYILNNRKHATYWKSTRDTALCIEALSEYLVASGEDKPDLTLEIALGDQKKQVKIDSTNLFTYDDRFVLFGDAVETGKQTVQFKKQGTGPVYFNAYLTNFTLEDFITKAGLEIKVNRKVYKLKRVEKSIKVAGSKGQAADQKVEKYERELLENNATLTSGDLVEVELEIDSKNDYEYVVFEDMKAAGFEPVSLQSGYVPNDLNAYVEFRDERVAFFSRTLARGKHSVSYRLRAEIPGKFSALPTKAWAMYAPELKANSDEIKLAIEDKPVKKDEPTGGE